MPPLLVALMVAANLVPSDDEAMDDQFSGFNAPEADHDFPELLEVQMPLLLIVAANFVPSDDEATQVQNAVGALLTVQVVPELV